VESSPYKSRDDTLHSLDSYPSEKLNSMLIRQGDDRNDFSWMLLKNRATSTFRCREDTGEII